MTIQDLGSIGELVAAIATVATLLYLAVQIRHNTRQMRATTFQGVTQGWRDAIYAMLSDDRSLVWTKGSADPTSLNEEEAVKFVLLVRAYFRGYENDYYQFRQGTFDAEAWEGYLSALRNDGLSRPGIRAAWQSDRANFNREFAAFVDRELEATAVQEVADPAFSRIGQSD